MEAHIPKFLKIHMDFFKIIGFCSVSLDENLKRNLTRERCSVVWSLLLLIGFNGLIVLALMYGDEFLFPDDAFGYFNDVLKVVFADIAVTVSYLETILRRSEIVKFWKVFNHLQRISSSERNSNELWAHRRFLVIFYLVNFSEVSTTILFIILQPMTQHLISFNSVFMPFVYAAHMRNMQFIFYIEILRSELLKLQRDLHSIANHTSLAAYGSVLERFGESLRSKLWEKQKHYQLIYEMHECFLSGFGFSIVAVLLMVYVCILSDAYFAYYTVYQDLNKTEILLLIPACMQIPAFLITSKNCMEVVKLITFNLHSIGSQFENQTGIISAQLQNFSLQILHQRICINGIGISRMDGYMLTRAIGSVTTYMIFFIQFMPKFTAVPDEKKQD